MREQQIVHWYDSLPAGKVERWQQLEAWYGSTGRALLEEIPRLRAEVERLRGIEVDVARARAEVQRFHDQLGRAGEEIEHLRKAEAAAREDARRARQETQDAREMARLASEPQQHQTTHPHVNSAASSVPTYPITSPSVSQVASPPMGTPLPVQSGGGAAGPSGAAPGLSGDAARVAEAFVAWCRGGSAVVARAALFASAHGLSVRPIYRDCKAPLLELSDTAPSNPAEYWVVATGGQTWLVPQPLSAHQFREVDARCFNGSATPAFLTTFEPAQVEVRGGSYQVVSKGRLA